MRSVTQQAFQREWQQRRVPGSKSFFSQNLVLKLHRCREVLSLLVSLLGELARSLCNWCCCVWKVVVDEERFGIKFAYGRKTG